MIPTEPLDYSFKDITNLEGGFPFLNISNVYIIINFFQRLNKNSFHSFLQTLPMKSHDIEPL